jgi:hypothetical protein
MVSDSGGRVDASQPPPESEPLDIGAAGEPPTEEEVRLTRRVHVVLGAVVSALGAWLL